MYIWIVQKALTQRLAIWAWVSIALGVLCFLPGSDFRVGLAFQFFGWALASLALGGFGHLSARRHQARLTLAEKMVAAPEETSKMLLLLQGSAALGLLCLLGGLALVVFMQAHGSFWAGAGTGITLQGVFVLFFSRYYARKLR